MIEVIKGYHQTAGQPLKTIHLAGDEVATDAWTESPKCDALGLIAENSKYICHGLV